MFYNVIGDHLDAIEGIIANIDRQIDSEYNIYYLVVFCANIFLYLCLLCLLAHQVNKRIVAPIVALTKEIKNPEQT